MFITALWTSYLSIDFASPIKRETLCLGRKKERDKTTDRQTNSTPFTGVCRFFLCVKFVTSLLALLPGGLGNFILFFILKFSTSYVLNFIKKNNLAKFHQIKPVALLYT